jgi:hypothetical protein
MTLTSKALADARSSMPSALKSPTATERGPAPVAGSVFVGELKVPSALARSTLTVSPAALAVAVARSRRPSPLKSPVTTAAGAVPVA